MHTKIYIYICIKSIYIYILYVRDLASRNHSFFIFARGNGWIEICSSASSFLGVSLHAGLYHRLKTWETHVRFPEIYPPLWNNTLKIRGDIPETASRIWPTHCIKLFGWHVVLLVNMPSPRSRTHQKLHEITHQKSKCGCFIWSCQVLVVSTHLHKISVLIKSGKDSIIFHPERTCLKAPPRSS